MNMHWIYSHRILETSRYKCASSTAIKVCWSCPFWFPSRTKRYAPRRIFWLPATRAEALIRMSITTAHLFHSSTMDFDLWNTLTLSLLMHSLPLKKVIDSLSGCANTLVLVSREALDQGATWAQFWSCRSAWHLETIISFPYSPGIFKKNIV